jgi:hypothetical protein
MESGPDSRKMAALAPDRVNQLGEPEEDEETEEVQAASAIGKRHCLESGTS